MNTKPLIAIGVAVGAIMASTSLTNTFGADTVCYHPETCKGYPTESSFRIKCNTHSYGDNPAHLQPDADNDIPSSVEECVPSKDLKGSFDSAGKPLASLECGKLYVLHVKYFTKGQELPNSPIAGSVKISIGPIEVTVPVGLDEWCNIYTPIVDPDSRSTLPGQCGGQALDSSKSGCGL